MAASSGGTVSADAAVAAAAIAKSWNQTHSGVKNSQREVLSGFDNEKEEEGNK